MTSDPHRHVFINLYIWKRSLPENRFWFVSSGKKKKSSVPWEPRVLGIAQAQRAEWSISCVIWGHHIICHTLTRYRLCVSVLHLTLDVILGSLFSQTFSALSNNLHPALVPLNTSKHQSSMQLLCVCDVTYDRTWLIPYSMVGFLCYWSTEFTPAICMCWY